MAATFQDPDELIPCPYDPVHMVARKRMPYHIMKCRKNFGQRDYAVCPFNARHVIPKVEFQDHISRCEDRGRVEAELMREQEDREKEGVTLKGNTNIFTSNFVTDSTESWDDDSHYVVEIKPQDGLFSQPPSARANGRPHPPKAVVSNPPEPRMPRSSGPGTEVYNSVVQQQKVPVSMGRGRGRGRGAAGQGQPSGPARHPPGFAPLATPPLSKEELLKQERKLKKMLRQIESLEMRKQAGEELDPDQEKKILRGQEVIIELEKTQAKLSRCN